MQSSKQTYYKDDDFHLETEQWGDVLFLHCHVDSWKLSVLKQMYKVFSALKTEAIEKKYSTIATVTPNPKFAELFGGVKEQVIELNDKEYEVVRWELS